MGLIAPLLAFAKILVLSSGLPVFLVGALIERMAPAERSQPLGHVFLNLGYAMAYAAIFHLLNPFAAVVGTGVVNLLGGGLLHLPDGGWAVIASAAVFIFAMDFMEYVFHRAQHAIPFLWSMHSLHHSDPSVNVTTTTRAFWIEPAIKAIFIYPVVGILFQVPPAVYAIYGVAGLYHFVNHLNLRLHFGRFWMLLNGPQFHRIHHSARPEHFDRNFAAFFPIFDVIFGTAHRPRPDEFPATGIDTREPPRNLLIALFWPFLGRRTRPLAQR